jgi:hypothetical protein
MTPEMVKKFSELQKKKTKQQLPEKPTMTYKQYYNKRFLEEAKFFVENPKFSMKYMMVMAHLQKTIKEKSLKEYKEKYPGYPLDELEPINEEVESTPNDKSTQVDTESIMSDYDIIDDTNVVPSNDSYDLNEVKKLTKFNNKDLEKIFLPKIKNIDPSVTPSSLSSSDVTEHKNTLRRSRRLQPKTI